MTAPFPAPELASIEQLIRRLGVGVRVVDLRPLGPDASAGAGHKAAGYGQPLKVVAEDARGRRHTFVVHSARADAYGHDRRADRIAATYLAHDTFRLIPGHVAPIDVGFVTAAGLVSAGAEGEPYLLTRWAEGRPYADDLRRIVADGADGADLARVRMLATWLAELHAQRLDAPEVYRRAVRDLVGSGEGIFGIIDGYPDGTPAAPAARLRAIEARCAEWRWRLRGEEGRLARIHGDFHPFNVLHGEDGHPVLVDASRGCAGDPADDVAALAINYLFFAADLPARWPDFKRLWTTFWNTYLDRSGDAQVLAVIPPWLAWRGLVVAHPAFYPQLTAAGRERVLGFVERVLAAGRLDPAWADACF